MEQLTLVIGNKNYSSWSLRAYLAVAHVGVAYEEILIPLDQPDTESQILAYSPGGRVPAIRHGSRTIWDSLAICEYLAEAFPLAQLWPRDRDARTHARCVVAEMHAGFPDLRHDMPMNLRRVMTGHGHTTGALANLKRIFAIWNECRGRFGQEGKFLFGRFSIADCFYAPVVTRCRTYGVPLDETCEAYAQAIMGLHSLKEWTTAARREHWVIRDYEM